MFAATIFFLALFVHHPGVLLLILFNATRFLFVFLRTLIWELPWLFLVIVYHNIDVCVNRITQIQSQFSLAFNIEVNPQKSKGVYLSGSFFDSGFHERKLGQ